MKVTDFKRHIDKTILRRGRDYYHGGRVAALHERDSGHYTATVMGTDRYSVEIEVDENGQVRETSCDCPYTGGPYCKHIAAVFFALVDQTAKTVVSLVPKTQKATRLVNRPQEIDKLAKQLNGQSKEWLVKLLMKLADEDQTLRDRLQAEVAPEIDERKRWLRVMRHSIDQAMDCDGFISYHRCRQAVEGACQVLQRAQAMTEEGRYEPAVDLALCVMQQMLELLQFADDSGGDVGLVMEEATSLLSLAAADMPEASSAACFRMVLQAAAEPEYQGWTDFRMSLLNICALLTRESWQRNLLEEFLDELLAVGERKDSWSSQYEAESIALLRYELIGQFDGPLAAADFLHRYRHFSRLREIIIQQALAAGNFAGAEALALEGERQDKTLSGLAHQWKKYRLDSYRLGQDKTKLLTLGRELAVTGDFADYQAYKALYEPDEWARLYPELLAEIARQPGYFNEKYTEILIMEQDWPALLAYVQKSPRLILSFYRQLLPDYREQVYELFTLLIRQEAAASNNRSHYKAVCSQLRLLAKIGNKEAAGELAREFLQQYPRRPAFREELQQYLGD